MDKAPSQQTGKIWYINSGVVGINLNTLPRCQAIAKYNGKRCGNPTMKDSDLCCIHAGFYKPSGAPKGNKHNLKHGLYSAETMAEKKRARQFIKETEEFLFSFVDR